MADEIRSNLLEQYGVTIDDFCNEWRVACDDYVRIESSSPNARVLSEEEAAMVQEQLMKRSAFKKNRDYEAADQIRDELWEQYGVKVDDRTKEWRVEDVGGSIQVPTPSGIEDDGFDIDAAISAELDGLLDGDDNDEEEDSAAGGEMLSPDDLAKLTVPILKEMLKERGLKVSGKKAELVDRLLA